MFAVVEKLLTLIYKNINYFRNHAVYLQVHKHSEWINFAASYVAVIALLASIVVDRLL